MEPPSQENILWYCQEANIGLLKKHQEVARQQAAAQMRALPLQERRTPEATEITASSRKRKAPSVSIDLTAEADGDNNAGSEAAARPVAGAAAGRPTATATTNGPSLSDIDDDDPRLDEIKWDCTQIRRKITALIDSKEMKVSEFLRAADLSNRAYYAFMQQSGKWTGQGSSVYAGAHRLFMKREILGIKPKRAPAPSKKAKLETEQKYDVSSITLEGEEEGDVPVYDTCDEVRKKIRACLRESGMTKTAFCKLISTTPVLDQYGHLKTTPIATQPLTSFLGKKGVNDGNQSQVFYAAYVFFEKLRIRDGKPKTEFREDMERVWGADGFGRVTGPNQTYITTAGRTLYLDEYGRVRSS
ncbi:hypothetical protein BJX66DRAFT_318569 [Aspergillus keveii]|uniref:DUF7726 domain-containing protein n=1 Tax=Aspergillus keveii TaxID=714993 RepID=A0ABR4FJK0_9EURO